MANNREIEEPSYEERLDVILRHIDLEIKEKGEEVAIKEMRKHLGWYVKNLKDASHIRQKINSIEEREELIDCLTEYFNMLSNIN